MSECMLQHWIGLHEGMYMDIGDGNSYRVSDLKSQYLSHD